MYLCYSSISQFVSALQYPFVSILSRCDFSPCFECQLECLYFYFLLLLSDFLYLCLDSYAFIIFLLKHLKELPHNYLIYSLFCLFFLFPSEYRLFHPLKQFIHSLLLFLSYRLTNHFPLLSPQLNHHFHRFECVNHQSVI